ncbi:MAG: FAD-dependent oxidoreductase [Acidobacteria bacterium]|nr:FAD-dependent oxidoreductase [Acidobacteriota bacterium]
MRIAIGGAGISGLVCAHRLSPRHEVTVFEAADRIGGHTHTIPVDLGGERHHVDTGFIVYNERYYPHFTRLLSELGVRSKPTKMGFSLRCDATGLEYSGASLSGIFAQRRNVFRPRFLRMLADVLRFQREGCAHLADLDDSTTVAGYCEQRGFSPQFRDQFLVPLGSALWSSPFSTFRRFPVRFVIEFLSNHGMMQIFGRPDWRVVEGGSCQYLDPLTARFGSRIRLGTPVREVVRHPDHVLVNGERFDHLILACHADQALRLLHDPTPVEIELLRAFPYEENATVLHTDVSVLPRERRAWACWNYRLSPQAEKRASVTYNMNLLQGLTSKHTFCVSLNETGINPESVIRRITYHHPVFLPGRARAQHRHAELIAHHRTSYCGAYWGFGFHEDGVRSAVAVCKRLGELPV